MPKFVSKTNILRNGETFAEGDILTLTEKEAEQMLASASIEPAPEKAKPEKEEKNDKKDGK